MKEVVAVVFACLLGWHITQCDTISISQPSSPNQLSFSKLGHQLNRIHFDPSIAFWHTADEKLLKRNLLFEETFEGRKPLRTAVNLQTGTDYGFAIVEDPIHEGQKAGRFELRVSDPIIHRGKRSELFVIDRITHKERWYSFAAFFPANGYAPDSSNELISQWHQEGSPPISLRTVDNTFYLRVLHNTKDDKWKVFELAPLTKDVWHEFVFHIIHSEGKDALIEVWHNDLKVLTYRGRNNMEEKKMPYWKVGVYKAKWNQNSTASDKRVVYFDNIRVGNELAAYSDLQPSKSLRADRELETRSR